MRERHLECMIEIEIEKRVFFVSGEYYFFGRTERKGKLKVALVQGVVLCQKY